MTQVNFTGGFKLIAINEPFNNPAALIDLLRGEQVLATIMVNVDDTFDAVWLTGDIGWRITALPNAEANARIRLQIKRNGYEIYRKEQDSYIPLGSACARATAAIMHLDLNPGSGPVTYQLVASKVAAENTDWFAVVGPVTFFAGGLKNLSNDIY